ncbi:HIRAN domain-containing protein [Sphingobium sp.]|uniref:HIRAN domain-containing protein n=1 Tax=Sphingobium sp. TaxID=1912891 RepID=UPI003BB5225D
MPQLSLAIVGADHPNKDKSNRRSEILWSAPGEPVDLIPEPKNPVDPQAVAVFSARGVQIGYVKSFQAQLIRTYLARGRLTAAIFQDVAPWGAVIRLGLDGEHPTLPEPTAESPIDDDEL